LNCCGIPRRLNRFFIFAKTNNIVNQNYHFLRPLLLNPPRRQDILEERLPVFNRRFALNKPASGEK
jgi:hypothetical protein